MYSNRAKSQVLDAQMLTLYQYGGVSIEAVKEMVDSSLKNFNTNGLC